jgi:hypothetical protein
MSGIAGFLRLGGDEDVARFGVGGLSDGPAAVTNGQAPDGHHGWRKIGRRLLSVHGDAVRLIFDVASTR